MQIMIEKPKDAVISAFNHLLDSRRSCRAFKPDQVSRPTIEAILRTAQRTPSWCNSQPWQVLITSGAATERFRAMYSAAAVAPDARPDFAFPREYRGVYQTRRKECGLQLYESVGVVPGDRQASARQAMENYRLFGAPHVAIVTTAEELGTYGAVDCGGYVNNFMLAAFGHGVASIAQAALARNPDAIRRHFALEEDRKIVCGISFGYPDEVHPANSFRTSRADIAEAAVFFE